MAYPDRYWSLIKQVGAEYDYDLRIFIARWGRLQQGYSFLGRREGLSQLVPATGKRYELARTVRVFTYGLGSTSPSEVGTCYLFDHFDNNAFLAVAGYNAGEGNVGKWVKRFGHIPSDEFVEHSVPRNAPLCEASLGHVPHLRW